MKLTLVFLTAAFLNVSASGISQSVTISGKNIPLKQVFSAIKDQTGYFIFANETLLENTKPVSLSVVSEPLSSLLEFVFKDQPIIYRIDGKTIILSRKASSVAASSDRLSFDFLPPIKIRVTDSSGAPLARASVSIKNTKTSLFTDAEGLLSLIVKEGDTLLISFVGYATQEIFITSAVVASSDRQLLIKLIPSITKLEQVEVVYSTGIMEVPKERATGSFVQINNELFNRRVGPSILDRIVDVTPGLLFHKVSGGTNMLDDIKIRGISTINSSKRPLLVIDNFIYDGDLSSVNVNDIATVTVLKDAAAASIWGARAGNGVIVLTTKKGRFNQRNTVSFSSDFTFGLKPDLSYIPAIPSKDIVALQRKRFADSMYNVWDDVYPSFNYYGVLPETIEIMLAMRKGTISAVQGEARLAELENHDIRNDIKNHLIQTSLIQQYGLNISGGSANYQYYGSVGYNMFRPNAININNEGATLRLYQVYKLLKNLEINGEINWTKSQTKNHNLLAADPTYWSHPFTRLIDGNGYALPIPKDYRLAYVDTVSTKGLMDWHYRPLDEAGNGNMVLENIETRLSGSINYEIIKGLSINSSYQWLRGNNKQVDQKDVSTYYTRNKINQVMQTDPSGNPIYPYPLGTIYKEGNGSLTSWNFRGQINWNKQWGNHSFYSLAGIDTRETIFESINMPEQFGLNPETFLFSPTLVGNWKTRPGGGTATIGLIPPQKVEKTDRYASYYANISYSYHDKYQISASGRVDKSNFFGVKSNDRTKPMWHAGVAWNLSKENFYRIEWLNLLKLRATFGYSGNTTSVSPLATAQIVQLDAPFYLPAAYVITPPNPQLSWERVKTINLALDFGFDHARLYGSIELYLKKGIDLISSLPIDPTSGFSSYQGNNASVKGKGIDFNINWKIFAKRNFEWLSVFILSCNTDEVTSYLVEPAYTAGAYLQNPIVLGKPVSYVNSWQWAGLDSATGDALLYVDRKKVGSKQIVNAKPEDLVYSGRTTPKVFGAFRNDFNFGNFSLSINFNYRFGYIFRRASFTGSLTDMRTWNHADYLSAWKKPGDEKVTNVPGFLNSYPDRRYQVYPYSDILIEKGNLIRLQDIRVSYSFGKTCLQRLGINGASIYLYANNLGIVWRANNHDLDPDAAAFGSTPTPKTIALGIKFTF